MTMRQPVDHVMHSLRYGGVAFVAETRGEKAYLETTGWAEREGRWHLFVDGRTPCRKYAITSTRERLSPILPQGVKVCARCKKEQE